VQILQALGVAAALAASSSAAGTGSATVDLSSHRAGARPVALTLRLHYQMQCGWPGPGPLTIHFPTQMTVPPAIAPAAILINGNTAGRIGGGGHRIALDLPPRPQILCDAIAPGTLTVRFTGAARLGNPTTPGTYRLHATKAALAFAATLRIRRR
jgi:hypothetical protein